MRAQNNAGQKRLAVAAYYNPDGWPDSMDDHMNAFNDDFNELSFGGRRIVMHLHPVTGHQGRHGASVMDIESDVGAGGMYVILEEK